MLKIAVIGVGNMGFAHAKCLYENEISGCSLVALCDIDKARLDIASKAFPGIQLFSDAEEMFEVAKPQAVVIATPHTSHAQLAISAIKKGIHILSEKPAGIVYSAVAEACQAARQNNIVYSVMFNQRNNPVFRKLYSLLQSGELGGIKRVSWTVTNWYRTQCYYNSGDWRGTWRGEGGGVLINQAPHNLDIICMLFGLPLSVKADCVQGKYHSVSVEDEAIVDLKYKDFSLLFTASTGECPGTNRMEIAADFGKVVVENGRIIWTKLSESERDICCNSTDGFVNPKTEIVEIPVDGEDNAHKGILQNFVNAVTKGEKLIASGDDGLNEIMLSNAAYLSSWTNSEIMLPLSDNQFELELQKRINNEPIENKAKAAAHQTEGYMERWNVRW